MPTNPQPIETPVLQSILERLIAEGRKGPHYLIGMIIVILFFNCGQFLLNQMRYKFFDTAVTCAFGCVLCTSQKIRVYLNFCHRFIPYCLTAENIFTFHGSWYL